MNQLGLAVYTNMRLHPEVPLVALFGRLHVWITLVITVFGGAGCIDDGGINDGASVYFQAIFFEVLVDVKKQSFGEVVALHEVAKLADGGLVWRGLLAQVDLHELAHGTGVI